MPRLNGLWLSRGERDDGAKPPMVCAGFGYHNNGATLDHLRRHKASLKVADKNLSGLYV